MHLSTLQLPNEREPHLKYFKSIKTQLIFKFASKTPGAEGKAARCNAILIPHGMSKSVWLDFFKQRYVSEVCGFAVVDTRWVNKTVLQGQRWSVA